MGEAESRERTIIAAVELANGKSLDQIGAAVVPPDRKLLEDYGANLVMRVALARKSKKEQQQHGSPAPIQRALI